jgi:DNA-binding response OmpR family regulator
MAALTFGAKAQTPVTKPEILIAERDPSQAEILGRIFTGHGYQPTVETNLAQASQRLGEPRDTFALVVAGVPQQQGVQSALDLVATARDHEVPAVLMLEPGMPQQDQQAALKAVGPQDVVTKPFNLDVLMARVDAYAQSQNRPQFGMNVLA